MKAYERIVFVVGGCAFGTLGFLHFLHAVGVPTDSADPSLPELGLVLAISGAVHIVLGALASPDRRGVRVACRVVNGVDAVASFPAAILALAVPPAIAPVGALLLLNVSIGRRLAGPVDAPACQIDSRSGLT